MTKSKNKLQYNSRAVPWLSPLSHTITVKSGSTGPWTPSPPTGGGQADQHFTWHTWSGTQPKPGCLLHQPCIYELEMLPILIYHQNSNTNHKHIPTQKIIVQVYGLWLHLLGTQECHLNSCWANEKNHRSEFKTKWCICTRAWWTYRNAVQKPVYQ